ncbi:MAG: ABC transporter permease [Actinomycetota bacterium]|nr:ABC transporter permease [Actinomycetota bacterium]
MNSTVTQLTWHSLLGRRRAWLLMVLPAILLLLAVVVRLAHGQDAQAAVNLLGAFALGFLVPLICLIAGTGSIGPEIDDGSIMYLLAKPLSRPSIVHSKLLVAVAVATLFGAVPTLFAGLVVASGDAHVALGYAVGALLAGIAYSALFLLLAILTRNAVVVGLLYALVWESVVGGYVPGAQALSIQQWSLAVTEKIIGSGAHDLQVDAAVSLPTGLVLLVVVTVAATVYAGRRLRSIRITSDE